MDGLERPQSDESVHPAAVWEALIRTAAKVVKQTKVRKNVKNLFLFIRDTG